ncbi:MULTISPECIES: hypothetical protein [unclassified Clostridioides]|uniref:hypothetical protein n=1 Tax=unclassified Clostridioides TaxID=2635829 RepID=UPI0038A605D1
MLTMLKSDNEIEEVNLLIKFGTKENLEKLKKGEIYTNNLKYFIDLEETYGKIGIGDRDESALLLNGVNFRFFEANTRKPVRPLKALLGIDMGDFEFKASETRVRVEGYTRKPVFCLLGISKSDLEYVDKHLILSFDDNKIKYLEKEFGNYTHALIIEAGEFIKRIIKVTKTRDIGLEFGYVKYYNPNINQFERIRDFNTSRRAFWKKDYFKRQQEFRIIFDNILIDSGQILINIGDISDISAMCEINDLLSKDFELELNY